MTLVGCCKEGIRGADELDPDGGWSGRPDSRGEDEIGGRRHHGDARGGRLVDGLAGRLRRSAV